MLKCCSSVPFLPACSSICLSHIAITDYGSAIHEAERQLFSGLGLDPKDGAHIRHPMHDGPSSRNGLGTFKKHFPSLPFAIEYLSSHPHTTTNRTAHDHQYIDSPPSTHITSTTTMPRQSRGPARSAPSRPTAAPAPRPAAPQQQQTRPASTAAHPPQQQQAPPQAQQGSQGPGLFGQMASTAA